MRQTIWLGPALLLAMMGSAEAGRSIGEVAWIEGKWRGTTGSGSIEEIWSAPEAGTMTGMFRWTRNGKLFIYEFLAIEEAEGELVMRLRHFSPGLVAWEEKDAPVSLRLVELDGQRAVFDTESEEKQVRITYSRDSEGLLVVLETEEKDGPRRSEFRYAKC